MNIFSKLPFFNQNEETVEPTADELKKERIEFHARSVRNGPASFKTQTRGQFRRAQERVAARRQKNAYRSEVREHIKKQRLAAVVRGHLQAAGVVPYISDHIAPLPAQIASTGWLVQRFGVEATTGTVSFRREDVVTALVNAAKFYNSVTGAGIKFPTDFVPAISLAEDVA